MRVKEARPRLNGRVWCVLPCSLLLLYGVVVRRVHIPLGSAVVTESRELARHFEKKRDASSFPLLERRYREEIALLDSVIERIEQRDRTAGGMLVDELHGDADSAGFRVEKIEAGMPRQVGGFIETGHTIEGMGDYRAVGSFIERIENSDRSTRIRQVIVRSGERRDLSLFVDVVQREAAGSGGEHEISVNPGR